MDSRISKLQTAIANKEFHSLISARVDKFSPRFLTQNNFPERPQTDSRRAMTRNLDYGRSLTSFLEKWYPLSEGGFSWGVLCPERVISLILIRPQCFSWLRIDSSSFVRKILWNSGPFSSSLEQPWNCMVLYFSQARPIPRIFLSQHVCEACGHVILPTKDIPGPSTKD